MSNNKVKKLAKRKLKDVLTAIPPIKRSAYKPLRIKPHSPHANLPPNITDLSVELMHRKKSDDLIASIYMGELLTI